MDWHTNGKLAAGELLVPAQEDEASMVGNYLLKNIRGRTFDNIRKLSENVSEFMAWDSKAEIDMSKTTKLIYQMDDKMSLK